MKKVIFILSIAFGVISCASTKQTATIKLTPKQPDVYTKPILSEFLSKNKKPAVIIRVPEQNSVIANSNIISLSSTYNTIEKEFVKEGYIVRDRAIFEKVANQNQSIDYSKLQSITGVDLLIELVSVSDFTIITNKYYDKKGREKTMNTDASFTGKKIEFKIVKLKENEIAGNYTFFFTPCIGGCTYAYYPQWGLFDQKYTINKMNVQVFKNMPYEAVFSSDSWELFIKQATDTMIQQMKNN
ncbi:hypothetical protein ETU08_08160 [Apibacter muscae]|uniref:hypothetical protein n=1 Tax=Apibacter muscae TaxID=2509004 RepID=UPI0011AD7EE2|nr:hypothetical protein [Apibacter muscae]TWP29248.1 hypothetical protein ETU08_08160 [Apibacter muscae]